MIVPQRIENGSNRRVLVFISERETERATEVHFRRERERAQASERIVQHKVTRSVRYE